MRHRLTLTRCAIAGVVLLTLLAPAGPSARAAAGVDGVAGAFQAYYDQHEGLRVLGHPLTGLFRVGDCPVQYFEKGRLEDHRAEISDPAWAFMYGLLTPELMDLLPQGSVSGTNVTYHDLQLAAQPGVRVAPPSGFRGGTMLVEGGQTVFVPADPWLRPAPGHTVPLYFWRYITRPELFPGGWLHDVGLPLTSVLQGQVTKGGESRNVVIQGFERAVLTYDARNPAGWQVERANIGSDAGRILAGVDRIETPAPAARVMLPLHLLVRVGAAGDVVTAQVRWANGTQLTNRFTLLAGEDGRGLLIGNLDWVNLLQPPEPPTGPATLEIHAASGALLLARSLTVVSPRDPQTTVIQVYWTVSGSPDLVQPQQRRILQTTMPGTAALQELLWGPPATSQVGFGTALPTPANVLRYPGRSADWGPRVTLRGLTIVSGVATADFSRELRAYGGGSTRVKLIHDQIGRTLLQFPTVRQVRIAIEGQTDGVLEP